MEEQKSNSTYWEESQLGSAFVEFLSSHVRAKPEDARTTALPSLAPMEVGEKQFPFSICSLISKVTFSQCHIIVATPLSVHVSKPTLKTRK